MASPLVRAALGVASKTRAATRAAMLAVSLGAAASPSPAARFAIRPRTSGLPRFFPERTTYATDAGASGEKGLGPGNGGGKEKATAGGEGGSSDLVAKGCNVNQGVIADLKSYIKKEINQENNLQSKRLEVQLEDDR
jgi:hypothetical protein